MHKKINKKKIILSCFFALVLFSVATCSLVASRNALAVDGQTGQDASTSNAWETRMFPRDTNFLNNLISRYYGSKDESGVSTRRELKATVNSTTNPNNGNLIPENPDPTVIRASHFPKNSKGEQYIRLVNGTQLRDAENGPGFPSDGTIKREETSQYVEIDPSQMPTDNKFPSDHFISIEPETTTQSNLGVLWFGDAGLVDGKMVDMFFRINAIRIKSTSGSENISYGHYAKNPNKVGYVFLEIRDQTIYDEFIAKGEAVPDTAGTIMLHTDLDVWRADADKDYHNPGIQLEVDYTIGIVDSENPEQGYNYPVYTLYSDLDVQNGSSEKIDDERTQFKEYLDDKGRPVKAMFDESVTPYENVYPFAYRFTPSPGAESGGITYDDSDWEYKIDSTGKKTWSLKSSAINAKSPFYMQMVQDGNVKSGYPTFKAMPFNYKCTDPDGGSHTYYATSFSGGFPNSWLNTGVIITSNPSTYGYYSSVWRGHSCGTGISLSPCPSLTCQKSLDGTDIAKMDGKEFYTFNVDFGDKDQGGTGKYGEDLFDPYDTLEFADYLPVDLQVTQTDLQKAIEDGDIKLVKYDKKTDTETDIKNAIGKNEDGKYIIKSEEAELEKVKKTKITLSLDKAYLQNTANYDGTTWRMKIKAKPIDYQSGERVQYHGEKEADYYYKYQNIGAVNTDETGYWFYSQPVDVYTPLYSKDYTFYKEGTTDSVPDVVNAVKPKVSEDEKHTIQVGESVSADSPTKTVVRDEDNKGTWIFINWKEDSITCACADVHFVGYWRFIEDPVEGKVYNVGKEGCVTDEKTGVLVGDKIAYKLACTNTSTPSPIDIKMVDKATKGLAYNSEDVKPEITSRGAEYDIEANVKYEGSIESAGGFQVTCSNVPYGVTIEVTYEAEVTKDALSQTKVDNTLTVGSNTFTRTNPVIQPIKIGLNGSKSWADNIKPYNIQQTDYTVNMKKTAGEGCDFDSNNYNIDKDSWKWNSDEISFYLPGIYTFDIKENVPEDIPSGVTYDSTVHKASFNIVREGSILKVDGTPIYVYDFENVFTPVSDNLDITKSWDGDAPGYGTYKAKVEKVNPGDPAWKACDDKISGEYTFDNLKIDTGNATFNEVGTYKYKVTEINTHEKSIKYDSTVYEVTFTVTKAEDGQMSVTKSVDSVNFTNNFISPTKEYSDKNISESTVLHVGENIAYTIKADNFADVPQDVIFKDMVSEGLSYNLDSFKLKIDDVEQTPVVDIQGQLFTCVQENVPAGSHLELSYTCSVTEQALIRNEVENSAKVQVGEQSETIMKPLHNPVDPKSANPIINTPVHVNDEITYTIGYYNYNAGFAVNVNISDAVPQGTQFVEASDGGTLGEDGVVRWNMTVTGATHITVSFKVKVLPSALDVDLIANIGHVDVENGPKYDTNKITHPPIPDDVKAYDDTATTIIHDDSVVHVGDVIAYKVIVANTMLETANAKIKDTMSKGLVYKEGSSKLDGASIADPTKEADGTYIWDLGTLASGKFASLTYQATVTDEAISLAKVENNAKTYLNDNLSSELKPLVNKLPDPKTSDMTAYKAWEDDKTPSIVLDGDYKVKVTKASGDFTYGCKVKDDTQTIHDMKVDSKDNTCTWQSDNDFVTFYKIGSYRLYVEEVNTAKTGVKYDNSKYYVNYDVSKDGNTGQLIVVRQYLDAESSPVDSITFENTYTPPVKEYSDKNISESSVLHVGDEIGYTIKADNFSDVPQDVTFKDNVSEGLSYNLDSFKLKIDDVEQTPVVDIQGQSFTCVQENVPAGSHLELSYTCSVTEKALTHNEIENSAKVQVGEQSETKMTPLHNPVDPKSANPKPGTTVLKDEVITYTIGYFNYNEEAVDVTITDIVPQSTEFISATDDGQLNRNKVIWKQTVEPRTHIDVSFVVKVKDYGTTTVNNQAHIKVLDGPEYDTNVVQHQLGPDPNPPATTGDNSWILLLGLLGLISGIIVFIKRRIN